MGLHMISLLLPVKSLKGSASARNCSVERPKPERQRTSPKPWRKSYRWPAYLHAMPSKLQDFCWSIRDDYTRGNTYLNVISPFHDSLYGIITLRLQYHHYCALYFVSDDGEVDQKSKHDKITRNRNTFGKKTIGLNFSDKQICAFHEHVFDACSGTRLFHYDTRLLFLGTRKGWYILKKHQF